MRRFRRRRRRIAAAALLPLAATLTTSAFADSPGARPEREDRRLASAASRSGTASPCGACSPAPPNAPIEIRYRAQGASAWHTAARGAHRRLGRLPRAREAAPDRLLARRAGRERRRRRPATPSTGSERVAVRSKTERQDRRPPRARRRPGEGQGPGDARRRERRVVVRIGGEKLTTRAGRDGRFQVAWKAPSTGSYPVDVRARSNEVATGSRDSAGRVLVYRQAAASWYGPGLYGNTDRLRRDADAVDDGRRPQDAALRDEGPPALRRQLGHRAGDRSRAVRGQPRVRPDRRRPSRRSASPTSAPC